MAQITAKFILRLNGKELRSDGKGKITPGGNKREAVVGPDVVYGFKEETVAPELEFKLHHTADVSLKELQEITAATVVAETDTGKQFIYNNAFTLDAIQLDGGDGFTLKMSALTCDEV